MRYSRYVPPGLGPGEYPGIPRTDGLLAGTFVGEENQEVSVVRELWASLLRMLPGQPDSRSAGDDV